MERWFVYADSPVERQKDLVSRVGIQQQALLGFDINAKILEIGPGMLPVMAVRQPESFISPLGNFILIHHILLHTAETPNF
jgi:hypothetical protein